MKISLKPAGKNPRLSTLRNGDIFHHVGDSENLWMVVPKNKTTIWYDYAHVSLSTGEIAGCSDGEVVHLGCLGISTD